MQQDRPARGRPPHPDVLTPAEWRVLEALRLGSTNAEIAERLGVSVNTVRTHVSSMLAKLDLPDRHALATWEGEPAPESRRWLRRLGFAAPWLRFAALAAGMVALAATLWVALDASRDNGPAALAATASETPTSTASGTPQPSTTAEVPSLAALYDRYPVRPYLPPFGPTQCCEELIPTRIPPPTIEDANTEGARFGGEHRIAEADPPEFAGVPGTSDLACVDAAEADPDAGIRSGDFVLQWDLATPGATPTFLGREMSRNLLVRAVALDGSEDPAMHVHEKNEPATQEAAGLAWRFTPTLVLPEAGRWLMVATAGRQWGCFLVDAPEPPEAYRPARSIAEAEADGVAYPSEPPPARVSPSFARERGPDVTLEPPTGWTLRGGSQRVCVDIADGHDVRSGEWVVRPAWELFGDPYEPGVKVLIGPLHQPDTVEEMRAWPSIDTTRTRLRMTATSIDAPQHTYVFEATEMGAYTGNVESGTLEVTHISGPVLPYLGGWFYVVTDGVDGQGGTQWGCFASPGRGTSYPYPDS